MSRLCALLLLAAACERASQAPAATMRLMLSPAWATVAPGDPTRLHAATLGPQGDTLAVPTPWASADPTVATVDSAGLVRGRAQGVVTIEATAGLLAARITVAVEPGVLLGAGDIASCPPSGGGATAAPLDPLPGAGFTAGDNAYPNGRQPAYPGALNSPRGRPNPGSRPPP